MFNTNSDYVINKLDTDAIVCRSVTGQLLRITREDFSSDEEFEKWQKSVLKIAEKLKGYFDVSVMFNTKYDTYQYSPFDYTKEQFEEMFIERERL